MLHRRQQRRLLRREYLVRDAVVHLVLHEAGIARLVCLGTHCVFQGRRIYADIALDGLRRTYYCEGT
jgi:hypothetical protein